MKNSSFVALLLLILFSGGCTKVLNEYPDDLLKEKGKGKDKALVDNGHFEKSLDFDDPKKKDNWTKEGYILGSGIFTWSKRIGRNNSGGVSLEAGGGVANDMAVTQQVVLDPAKFYRLSAWVKTENVSGGTGANICVYNTWNKSESVMGTNDWRLIRMDLPPNSGQITIACRLGYWAGVSTGKAYFDDVTIEELEKFTTAGQHLRLVLDKEDVTVSQQTITSWMANLDKAYEKYKELMGGVPYGGAVITVLSVNTYPGGWAVAGNPILWYKPYIRQELEAIASTGHWSFGILHEIAHDFVLDNTNRNWIFNEEMFANFRMYYAVEQLNATILQGKLYRGTELENYYRTDAGQSYTAGIARGIPVGYDGLMYTLLRIKNLIGWPPIMKAMKELNTLSTTPATRWEKFNLFLDKLSTHAGQDVRKTYPPGELDVIRQLTLNN